MRLIDADALNEALGVGKDCADCQYSVGGGFCHRGSDFVDACEAIADAPTVDIPTVGEIIQRFSGYQIEWLKNHCDIHLEPMLEWLIVQFLSDTADCFLIETETRGKTG